MSWSAIVTGAAASFLIVSVSADGLDGLDGSEVPDGAAWALALTLGKGRVS